ncbi:mitochondrial import receptor subunit TOM20 homolog [Lycorma delicatula]|uniref:mitochondrial import receptor subunit TOM20 homolog n=1 Tax=Lycorma delicatula TaxID=130591 RepID=UPI003F518D29
MSMFSKAAVAAGVFGTIFIGYCIYFDRKRRSDPDFKKKLKERRRKQRECDAAKHAQRAPIPDLKDHEAVQMFFLREVQLGEELLGRGDVDGGIDHLCNAVAVCGQPNQLLQVLQQTLPPHVFQQLLLCLPTVTKRIDKQNQKEMAEEDVE